MTDDLCLGYIGVLLQTVLPHADEHTVHLRTQNQCECREVQPDQHHFSHYSVLYGSIGAVIVVLIWLNLTAVTLILGAEVNGVLISMRKDRLTEQ